MSNISDYITMEVLDVVDIPFSAQLEHLFSAHNRVNNEAIYDYITVDNYYWLLKGSVRIKVRVTHKYGGVIFYIMEDSDIIYHFDVGSVLCNTMIPCKICTDFLAYHIAKCRNIGTDEVYESLKKHGFCIPEGLEVEII